ncbi:hypothetical protein Gorai_007979 [Gossypium raimondii]|uniref:Uncharacterized protein n=1 Tax=Gossypium raimondii TaxID=29730 RepID=A0A7J8Q9D0_GOSRA|nr:hypothetical protein [Gossypium raimondii]
MSAVLIGLVMAKIPKQLLNLVSDPKPNGFHSILLLVGLLLDHQELHVDHGKEVIFSGDWLHLSL